MIKFNSLLVEWQDVESYATGWLSKVAHEEGLRLVQLSYTFLNDEDMRLENARLLEHDYYTDVITFGEVRGTRIYGDIIVSYERIRDNSKELNNNEIDERDRVLVHALLHLCGYDDHSDSDKLKMRELEDKYLALRP